MICDCGIECVPASDYGMERRFVVGEWYHLITSFNIVSLRCVSGKVLEANKYDVLLRRPHDAIPLLRLKWEYVLGERRLSDEEALLEMI